MDIQTEIARIERRMKAAGTTVAELLRQADVNAAQWVRWKQGRQEPLRTTWARITAAAKELGK